MGIILAVRGDASAAAIAGVLQGGGLRADARAVSGAQVLRSAQRFDACTVICDGPLKDMSVLRLREMLPPLHTIVLIGRTPAPDGVDAGILCVQAPMNRREFLGAIRMLSQSDRGIRDRRPARTAEEQGAIARAKELLMARFGMDEEQAHRFLQKRSMERGARLADTARIVLAEME